LNKTGLRVQQIPEHCVASMNKVLLEPTQLAWHGELLEIGNKSYLFHIKIKHIENCFGSVEHSFLPLAKTAKSPAWPLALLAFFTKQNSLPNL